MRFACGAGKLGVPIPSMRRATAAPCPAVHEVVARFEPLTSPAPTLTNAFGPPSGPFTSSAAATDAAETATGAGAA